MNDQQGPAAKTADPVDFSYGMTTIASRAQRLMADYLQRLPTSDGAGMADPLNVAQAFAEAGSRMMSDPGRFMQHQIGLWQDYMRLWQSTAQRMMGQTSEPVIAPPAGDRRFKDPAWQENEVFDFIKQGYLLTAKWLQSTIRDVPGLDRHTAHKLDFYTRQFVDAMAPSNFVLTNPEVLRETLRTGGENLVKGFDNLLKDLERGNGQLSISMTDPNAFEVGKNIAVTPGKVVFQNDLIQLLQYTPTTDTVFKRPLLIVPPWINKFYILDLRPDNSFIRWAVEQGHTVFVVSWVNPDESLADKSFEDYLSEGMLGALDAVKQATGQPDANVIGYCLGGTLLACTLAHLAATKRKRIASATFFTTMVDFSEAGDLGVFIDEEQLTALEQRMAEKGYLDGRAMATSFNMLRANDLIWSFVVNNYLLGKEPFPFDLLYWNSDSTRMPAAMHSFYLRRMYQENRLIEPGGITLLGTPIDLTRIETPSFIMATREDHIAPWKSSFKATGIYRGPVRFVLAASGHIAGVVNPPAAKKYSHWTGDKKTADPEDWFAAAEQRQGSWWPEWAAWVAKFGGKRVPARQPGEGGLPALEDAPGSYVKVKAQ